MWVIARLAVLCGTGMRMLLCAFCVVDECVWKKGVNVSIYLITIKMYETVLRD